MKFFKEDSLRYKACFTIAVLSLCACLPGCGSTQKLAEDIESTAKSYSMKNVNEYEGEDVSENKFSSEEWEKVATDICEQMEDQIPQLQYYDMEENLFGPYVDIFADEYDFFGRTTKDGYCYLIGINNKEKSEFSGLEIETEENENGGVIEHNVKLGYWNNETEFETKYELTGVESCIFSDDYSYLYLGIRQPEAVEIGVVFDMIVNSGEQVFLSEIKENGMQILPPTEGSFLQIRRWDYGTWHCVYAPVTQVAYESMISDSSQLNDENVDQTAIEIYETIEAWREFRPAASCINKSILDYVTQNSMFVVDNIENIKDIKQIKVKDFSGSEYVITDETKMREIENILNHSDYIPMSGCPYKIVVELTIDSGEVIPLQFAADGCDGFLLGSYSCYSPGEEDWEELCELLGISVDS